MLQEWMHSMALKLSCFPSLTLVMHGKIHKFSKPDLVSMGVSYFMGSHWMYEWGINLEFKSCLWASVHSNSACGLAHAMFFFHLFDVQHWIHKMSKRIKREWQCIIFHLMAHNHNLCHRISAYQIQSCLFTYQSAELVHA